MSSYIPYHNHDLQTAFMCIKSCEYHNKSELHSIRVTNSNWNRERKHKMYSKNSCNILNIVADFFNQKVHSVFS